MKVTSLVSSPGAEISALAMSIRKGPNGEFQLTPKPTERRGFAESPTKRSKNGWVTLKYCELTEVPAEWLPGDDGETETGRARRIGNFIAGMTDRFALTEHQRLFDSTPDLR